MPGEHESPRARIIAVIAFGSVIGLVALSTALSCSGRAKPVLSLVAGGDCLLDRHNGKAKMDSRGDRRWDALVKAAHSSDAFLFNLETTVGRGGSPKNKRFVFRAPAEALEPLSRFTRPVAALANNHAMDYGPEGLVATIAALDERGIAHAGAGTTTEEAWTEARIACPGGTLSVLSCGFDNEASSFSESMGAALAPVDIERLGKRIEACRETSLAVVVMLHWGLEYDTAFTRSEQLAARALVDSGADLVLGSGPHVVQGLEEYHGALICYSLGNLVFDDLGSDETSAALLVRMTFRPIQGGGLEKKYAVAPLRTRRISEGPSRPLIEDAQAIMRNLASRSPYPGSVKTESPSDENGLHWFSVGE